MRLLPLVGEGLEGGRTVLRDNRGGASDNLPGRATPTPVRPHKRGRVR
jgi:hypothetical protein